MNEINIYQTYEVKHSCENSYRTSNYEYETKKTESDKIMLGKSIVNLIYEICSLDNFSKISAKDNIIKVECFNPNNGEESYHLIEYRNIKEKENGNIDNINNNCDNNNTNNDNI